MTIIMAIFWFYLTMTILVMVFSISLIVGICPSRKDVLNEIKISIIWPLTLWRMIVE